MKKITIIGSANMDTKHYLASEFPDELTQESLNDIKEVTNELGGKGANQAIAAKTINPDVQVSFMGCIGQDNAGLEMLNALRKAGIEYQGVTVLIGSLPDGNLIIKNKNGEYCMINPNDNNQSEQTRSVIDPSMLESLPIKKIATDGRFIQVDCHGANRMSSSGRDCIDNLKPAMIDLSELADSDMIAIQMKMPNETTKYIIDYCKKHNKPLLIDPTPIDNSHILAENDFELMKQVNYLTPNEEEAFALIKHAEGKDIATIKDEFKNTPKEVRLEMFKEFVTKHPNVFITLGEDGVMYHNGEQSIVKPPYPLLEQCQDSTGAGDTFNGAFMASRARGMSYEEAIKAALAAARIKVITKGAQKGIPTHDQIKKVLKTYEPNKNVADINDGEME